MLQCGHLRSLTCKCSFVSHLGMGALAGLEADGMDHFHWLIDGDSLIKGSAQSMWNRSRQEDLLQVWMCWAENIGYYPQVLCKHWFQKRD